MKNQAVNLRFLKRQLSRSLHKVVLVGMLVFCFVLTSCENKKQVVLSLTDIHFNPFQDTVVVKQLIQAPPTEWDDIFKQIEADKIAIYDEETTPQLLSLLLKSMKTKEEGITAILFTGDILAHEFNDLYYSYAVDSNEKAKNEFIYKTVSYVSMKLRNTFPDTPIYFSLGNNDSYNGDYQIADNGAFLSNTSNLFYKNFIDPMADTLSPEDGIDTFQETYSKHGYYKLEEPIFNNCRIIGLNTIFFSPKYPEDKNVPSPGEQEIQWLDKELAASERAGEKVWLLFHIPPGVNVYSTEHNSSDTSLNISLQWKQSYNDRYLELAQRYHKTITASFAGHTHMDDFRLIYNQDSVNNQALGFIHISPSISPVFGNNPAYQLLEVDAETSTLLESTNYYINLSEENPEFEFEYAYTSTYNVRPNMQGLDSLYRAMPIDEKELNEYIKLYPSLSKATGIKTSWQWYWSGIGNITAEDYSKAYKSL